MQDTRYNGWVNYATWRINLELIGDNDDYWNELLDEMHGGDPEDIQYEMTQAVEHHVMELLNMHECESPLLQSYALAFVSDVSFYEIAKNLIESHKIENA